MLGLLALGITLFMIFTLVKNALFGKQLSREDSFNGSIDLIIPVTTQSDFFLEEWKRSLLGNLISSTQIRIFILIDGHHTSRNSWEELKKQIPNIEIHTFTMRPSNVSPMPWMLGQISSIISGDVIIIGDSELVPSFSAMTSLAHIVKQRDRSYFVLPQTSKMNTWGEALNSLNPSLAFSSFYGLKRWRLNIVHPLVSISQGWMGMSLQNFQTLDFKSSKIENWKEIISRQWQELGKTYYLAFGEKYLMRFYPQRSHEMVEKIKINWEQLWTRKDKTGFWIYFLVMILWSFPIIFFTSHPFWSLASLMLLILYRFFSKIIFQESWMAIFLHPLACLIWLWSLGRFIRAHFMPRRGE